MITLSSKLTKESTKKTILWSVDEIRIPWEFVAAAGVPPHSWGTPSCWAAWPAARPGPARPSIPGAQCRNRRDTPAASSPAQRGAAAWAIQCCSTTRNSTQYLWSGLAPQPSRPQMEQAAATGRTGRAHRLRTQLCSASMVEHMTWTQETDLFESAGAAVFRHVPAGGAGLAVLLRTARAGSAPGPPPPRGLHPRPAPAPARLTGLQSVQLLLYSTHMDSNTPGISSGRDCPAVGCG